MLRGKEDAHKSRTRCLSVPRTDAEKFGKFIYPLHGQQSHEGDIRLTQCKRVEWG